MVDPMIRNRLNDLIHPRFEELRDKLKDDITSSREKLSSSGNLRSGAALRLHHDTVIKQLEARVNVVMESIRKVVLALAIPYSDRLAADLKQELEWFVPLSLWELPVSYADIGIPAYREELIIDLRVKHERLIKKSVAELIQFCDELRNRRVTGNQDLGMLHEKIVLLDHQKDLLLDFVRADHAVPPERKEKFLIVETMGHRPSVQHAGLTYPVEVNIQDIESLGDAGLLRRGNFLAGSEMFSITPLGFKYGQSYRTSKGEPAARIVTEVTDYLHGARFKYRHGQAYSKRAQAEAALWGESSSHHLTTIGHLCREALQEFATGLMNQHNVLNANPDKTKTVDRLRTVLNAYGTHLSTTVKPFLESLLNYWGTVCDLIQRQEHGGLKEGEPLQWEDARRVVFQTAIVMFEVDRSLSSTKSKPQ